MNNDKGTDIKHYFVELGWIEGRAKGYKTTIESNFKHLYVWVLTDFWSCCQYIHSLHISH